MTMYGITGASGVLGSFVLNTLLHDSQIPPSQITLLTRKKDSVQAVLDKHPGIQHRSTNYSDVEGLKQSFSGITHLLLISTSEFLHPEVHHRNMISSIDTSSIQHVFYVSLVNTDTHDIRPLFLTHRESEQAIKDLSTQYKFSYTIIRNAWYAENWFTPASLKDILDSGRLVACCGETKIQVATRSDLGQAIGIVMANHDQYTNRTLTFVSSEVFTLRDAAQVISQQTGKDIQYIPLTFDESVTYFTEMVQESVLGRALAEWELDVSNEALLNESKDLENVLGRQPLTLKQIVLQALE